MAEENVKDTPKVNINPITNLPFGGGTINPETNLPDTNPITGKKFGLGLTDSEGKANYGSYNPSVSSLGGKGFVPSNIFTDTYTRYNQEPMENYKKYGVPMGRHFDWDELRARNQSNTETVLNGAGKALVTFGGALLENTIGFFAGLGEMATGGAYYDNAIGKTVDKWNNWAEEALPVYLTEAEQNYSTWEKMGTAHFWADDVLGGMSYTAAAAASIYLTGGGGLLTKGAKMATTAALGKTALYNTTKAVINGSKLGSQLTQGANLTNRLYSASQVLEAGAMMSLAEASVEARETQRTTYDNLVQNYLNENKTSNIDNIPKEKLKEFEEVSYHAGNTNFVMQMPVLMGTNLLMFGRSVSGFKAGSAVNKDVIWDSATEAYVSKLANKGFMSSTLSKLKPVAVQGLNEAFQESYQYGSSAFANSYHIDKYNNNGNGDISKALAAGWDAMGTQEGIESALIGFITGGFFGGGRAITSGQYSNRVEQADKLAGLLNGGTLINAASQYQSANAVSAASANMEMHLKNGNIKGYQDARFDFIAAQSLEMLERGGLEMYIEQLEESSNLSDSEFKKLYGYLETDKHGDPISIEKQSDGKNKHEVIDGIVKKVREFQKTYENINSRFTLPERTTGLPRLLTSKEKLAAEDKVYNQRANLRNQLILDAAGVKDRNRRMSNIQNNIQETADDVYMYNRDARGQNISMSNVLSEQQPSHKGVKTWQEPGLKENEKAFIGEDVGVDEQGNKIYAPGAPIDPNVRLEQQDIAEQPDRYDPVQQIEDTRAKLKTVEDQVRQSDPLAADKIAELSKDYIALLTDNNIAIKRYNDLSSNKVLQDQWTEALDVAIEEKIQKNVDEEAIKKAKEAKTAKDISDYTNITPGISPEAQAQMQERFEQLKKDENDAYKKYYNQVATLKTSKERLEALEDIDTKDLNESEKEGLRKAINSVTQQMQTEEMKNQSDEVTEEDVEVKETKQEIEEAFAPENVGGVESISEDGRVFQIEGTQYYNREDNPTDAILEKGNALAIKLQNEQGDTHFIKVPRARVEALKVAILESVQYKVDSNQGIAKQDILDRSELIIKENTNELKPSIKDAKKDSSSLRSEMYGLERSLDELLEIQDQLRTSLIQNDGATNTEINKNSTIKALKKQIKNTKAAITRRRNVLLNRNESVTPTISEITAVEQKALNDVNELTRTISELDGKILTAEETVKRTEALMEQYQDDPGSFQQVSKENADAQSVINDTTEELKQLYNLIEYKKQKLRRLENEKQNRPADPAEQTTPEDARETEKQITDGENPNTTTVPQEERVTVAANLGYQRVNSNNYILNPDTGSFTRIKNATDINIPGHSEVEAFTYKDQNGNILVVDSLTGTVLGKHKNAKTAGKQAVETLNQGNTTETFKTIIDQNQKVAPAYEPINTVKAKENSTPSEKRTQKVLTIENGKAKIVEDTPTPGPGQRGGMVVMTQAEVEEHDRQVSKDLSEVVSDASKAKLTDWAQYKWLVAQEKNNFKGNWSDSFSKRIQEDLAMFDREVGRESLKEESPNIQKDFKYEDYNIPTVPEVGETTTQPTTAAPVAPSKQMEKDLNRLGVKQSKGNLSKKELSEKAKEYGMSVKDFKLEINKWHLNYNIRFEIGELEYETLVQSRFLESADKQTVINEIMGYMRKSPEHYQKELPFQDISLETTMKAMMVAAAPIAPGYLEAYAPGSVEKKMLDAELDYLEKTFGKEKAGLYFKGIDELPAKNRKELDKILSKIEAPVDPVNKTLTGMHWYDYEGNTYTKEDFNKDNAKFEKENPGLKKFEYNQKDTPAGDMFNIFFYSPLEAQSILDKYGISMGIETFLKKSQNEVLEGQEKKAIDELYSQQTLEAPVAPAIPVGLTPLTEGQKDRYETYITENDEIVLTQVDETGQTGPQANIPKILISKRGSDGIMRLQKSLTKTFDTVEEAKAYANKFIKLSQEREARQARMDKVSEDIAKRQKGSSWEKYKRKFTKKQLKDAGLSIPPAEEQIKKSEYEVHVTGDMLSGWDIDKTTFNVPGVKIQDIRSRSWKAGERIFDESIQNGKKVFTIVDGSIFRGNRRAGISASMVFDENNTTTLENVKDNLTAIMDSLMGVTKGESSFTVKNINTDWGNLDIKEIATPSVTMEDNVPKTTVPIKPKKVYESNFSVKLANATKTINDFKHMPVDENGIKKSYSPDTINNEIVEIDDSVLLGPNVMEKQVEFELLPNDWFTEKHPQGIDNTNWNEVPIYVKIDGKRIGKLDTSKSEERQVLVEKLQAGEMVTTKVNNIIANNFNWAMTENFERVFFNPNEVMETGQVLLAFTEIETEDKISRPFWTLSEVANSKDQGDLARIEQDILALDRASAKTNYGQVAIVIRSKNNPAGLNRVSPGSTQYLTPKAQNVAIKALEEKNHSAAREIIASSIIRDASDSNTFIEFFLEDDTNMMVYRSPKLNKLVSINEHELSKALLGKTFEFGFVETYDPGTGFTEYRPLPNDQIKNTDSDYINDSLREDFESFLKGDKSRNREGKKYHIDRTLGNTVTPYTSKVTNIQYNSYQEYLFSEKEIGEKRSEGLGHNSIFAVDLVNSNGSFFNNPRVEFGKGDLKGSTAVEITNPVKQIKKISSSEQAELDRIKKEMGWSDDITECP